MKHLRAFTLVELLVVIGILAILSAVLFPVLASAKRQAIGAACLSQFRQNAIAHLLYSEDYDGRVVLASYKVPDRDGVRTGDVTWVQLLLAYSQDVKLYWCPADRTVRPTSPYAVYDDDLAPRGAYDNFYFASQRSNQGYNYVYLSPIVLDGRGGSSIPVSMGSIDSPSRTYFFIDSTWRVKSGHASGGGSYLVVPPCRYRMIGGRRTDTYMQGDQSSDSIYLFEGGGWTDDGRSTRSYGGVWFWHSRRASVSYGDGRARSHSLGEILRGCNVNGGDQGLIFDSNDYGWDRGD